ncbi:MAG: DUF6033 family protein [Lachnospiraceae bacterium]|nr:DUF6033 family protein [Lachnospiraceae bacterium]
MAGLYGVSAYQQINNSWKAEKKEAGRSAAAASAKSDQTGSVKESSASKVETKAWSPIDTASSLVPKKTDYGYSIGDVQLSDKAADYYEKLKSKYGNMEFIVVSKDMKSQVQKNAAAYGNANKMVVLIDEEKLEKMATDESYRNKYEGIIASSQTKLLAAKNNLLSTGANVKNFGMSVDEDGKESFFATLEKSSDAQKKRIEKKAAEKREHKRIEKKRAEKKAAEERIQKNREKKADAENTDEAEAMDDKEYVIFDADQIERLISKIQEYAYSISADTVMTDAEKSLGTRVDNRG